MNAVDSALGRLVFILPADRKRTVGMTFVTSISRSVSGPSTNGGSPTGAFTMSLFAIFALVMFSVSATAANSTSPVVVELFTSQGCSSCPPAEAFLNDLADRKNVLALEFHVDYWDYIGWKDRFAQPAFTARQKDYSRRLASRYVYTPQMVIDGRMHEIGSRRKAVEMEIENRREARKSETVPAIHLSMEGGKINVAVNGTRPGDQATGLEILLVTYDRLHRTTVTRGENAGRTLVNRNVVRSLERIGTYDGNPVSIAFVLPDGASSEGCAVLLQAGAGGPVIASASLEN